MNRPQIQECPEWANTYVNKVEGNVMEVLESQIKSFPDFINSLVEKGDYAYAPGKWTIKELVGHIIDTERILAYRLLCFARGEKVSLPGFDEDEYVANANFKNRSLFSFGEEFAMMRTSNMFLIKSLSEEKLNKIGIASERTISVRAIIWVLAGHIVHHQQIINERYK